MTQEGAAAAAIDPLRRVFIHNGRQFQTADGVYYERGEGDTIRRHIPKLRGKSQRRADKQARRKRRKA